MHTFLIILNCRLFTVNRARGEPSVLKRTDRHFRVTRMLVIYLCSFGILLLPHQIMWFILDFGGGDQMLYFFDVLSVLYVLTYSITISNPILFFVYNVEFRTDMWYILRYVRIRPLQLCLLLLATQCYLIIRQALLGFIGSRSVRSHCNC